MGYCVLYFFKADLYEKDLLISLGQPCSILEYLMHYAQAS